MKKLFSLLLIILLMGPHSISQVPYTSLLGDFGQPKQLISELSDVLYNACSRFSVTPNLPNLFLDDVNDVVWAIPAGTSADLSIDLTAKGEVAASGVTYPGGYIYVSFYSNAAAASVGGQLKYADGSWAGMESFINISPNAGAGYAVFQGSINARNWLTGIKLTLTAPAGFDALVARVEYHTVRATYELPPAMVTKYVTNKFYAPIQFQDGNNVNQAFITADGRGYFSNNVGIGITNPSSRLAVNGDITAKKVKVTPTGWPDYVFEKTYPLCPLTELQEYIEKNRRLPGIISEKEVQDTGLDLGDNQAALLKKIEELTLYAIRQDKEIERLKEQNKKISSLQDQLDEVKKMIGQLNHH